MKWEVNDAALMIVGGNGYMSRVVALTDDGKPVVEWGGSYRVDLNGQWERVGYYKRKFFGWSFMPAKRG